MKNTTGDPSAPHLAPNNAPHHAPPIPPPRRCSTHRIAREFTTRHDRRAAIPHEHCATIGLYGEVEEGRPCALDRSTSTLPATYPSVVLERAWCGVQVASISDDGATTTTLQWRRGGG
jgi:hypothetical protein